MVHKSWVAGRSEAAAGLCSYEQLPHHVGAAQVGSDDQPAASVAVGQAKGKYDLTR